MRKRDTNTDTELETNATPAQLANEADPDLPEKSSGKEFTVLEVRPGSGDLVLDAGEGSMFKASGGDLEAKPGDVVRVSYDETDENGYPVKAKATSIKS